MKYRKQFQLYLFANNGSYVSRETQMRGIINSQSYLKVVYLLPHYNFCEFLGIRINGAGSTM